MRSAAQGFRSNVIDSPYAGPPQAHCSLAHRRARAARAAWRMSTALSVRERRHAITRILEARFSVSAFEQIRRGEPQDWHSPRHHMARGIYGEAMRAKQLLVAASDERIEAELLDIALRSRAAAP